MVAIVQVANNLIVTFLTIQPITGPIYAEITDEDKDPSVGVATGKYTYIITTNSYQLWHCDVTQHES